MRSILVLFLVVQFVSWTQEITVEKIWKNYEFYPKGVDGLKSMNDGENYTRATDDLSIFKYRISDSNDKGELLMDGRLMT